MCGAYFLPLPPTKESSWRVATLATRLIQQLLLMYWAKSTQTLQIRVLQPVPKAIVHNESGLPMCAVAGLEPWTLAWTYLKSEASVLDRLATATHIYDMSQKGSFLLLPMTAKTLPIFKFLALLNSLFAKKSHVTFRTISPNSAISPCLMLLQTAISLLSVLFCHYYR